MSAVQQSVSTSSPSSPAASVQTLRPMPDGQGRDMLVKAKTVRARPSPSSFLRSKLACDPSRTLARAASPKPWLDMLKRHSQTSTSPPSPRRSSTRSPSSTSTTPSAPSSSRPPESSQHRSQTSQEAPHTCARSQGTAARRRRQPQLPDQRLERSRPDVVSPTPGRILDLLNDVGMMREAMTACRTLILDEADTLLEMGFRDDLQAIMKHLPAKVERQNMLFSATVSPEIRAIARPACSPTTASSTACLRARRTCTSTSRSTPPSSTPPRSISPTFFASLRMTSSSTPANPRPSSLLLPPDDRVLGRRYS